MTNVIANDFLFLRRLKTMMAVFKNVYLLPVQSSSVLFGNNGAPLESLERESRARSIANVCHFAFPFLPHAANVISLPEIVKLYPQLEDTRILDDSTPPEILPVDRRILRNVGRNDTCPCGSGKKYKKCHGRND